MMLLRSIFLLILLGIACSHMPAQSLAPRVLEDAESVQAHRRAAAEIVELPFQDTVDGLGLVWKRACLVRFTTPNVSEVVAFTLWQDDSLVHISSLDGLALGRIRNADCDTAYRIGTAQLPVGSEVYFSRKDPNRITIRFLGNNYPSHVAHITGITVDKQNRMVKCEYDDGFEQFQLD